MHKVSKAPEIKPIRDVKLPQHSVRKYPNGMKLIIVNAGAQEVFKLETIFSAGRYFEKKKLVSGAVLRMLREGAEGYTSEDIAEAMDFYGATLSVPTNLDYSGITLYGLNKDFSTLLTLYKAVVTKPTFPESELKNYITERKHRLQVDVSKNDIVAYRSITEAIFGSDHPYGYNSNKELYDELKVDDLKEHFAKHYVAGNCMVVISGKVNEEMIDVLEKEFFPLIPEGKSEPYQYEKKPSLEQHQYFSKPSSVQTAIRVGLRLFTRKHPDYFGLYFLNVILGEYFSSRLMLNIREDKGYTYNIYSSLDIMSRDGVFLVSTETANEYAQDTLKEIYIEFEKLQNELIPDDELEMARNFTLGTMLTALDGSFNASEVIKGLYIENMDEQDFNKLIHTIKNITKEELKTLAQKYLNKENMFTALVGK